MLDSSSCKHEVKSKNISNVHHYFICEGIYKIAINICHLFLLGMDMLILSEQQYYWIANWNHVKFIYFEDGNIFMINLPIPEYEMSF